MNAKQLRRHIIRPALNSIELWSENVEALIMGTAAQESHLDYVKQLGDGPALSLFQMEPATYYDIWDNYLAYQSELTDKIFKSIRVSRRPVAERLVWDFRLASIMCRLQYRRYPEAIPDKNDVWAQAALWKKRYNTPLGAGTEQEFVDNYRRIQ